MPLTVPPAIQRLLGLSHIYWIKIELYDGNTLLTSWEATPKHTNDTTLVTQGDVQIADNGQDGPQRGCNILIYDQKGQFLPSPTSPVWFRRTIKIYYGISTSSDEAPAYILIGTFHAKSVKAGSSRSARTVTIVGADLSYRVSKARFTSSGTINAGAKVTDQIRTFLSGVGFTTFNFVDSDALCSAQTYARSDDRWALCEKLATGAGLVLFFDTSGIPTLVNKPDPTKMPVSWSYDTTVDASLPIVSAEREVTDDQVYNHVLVVGENGSSGTFGEAKIDDPNDPLYVGANGENDIPYFIITSNGTTDADAVAMAQKQLAISKKPFDNITLTIYPNPYMEYGDIIYVKEPLTGIDGNYVLNSMTLSFDRSTAMTVKMVAQR